MKKFIVTGAAGFIGSNLVDKLLKDSIVLGIDNLSTGKISNLDKALQNPNFNFLEIDLLNQESLNNAFSNNEFDAVFHLAANADVKDGLKHPHKDLQQNTIATFNVLEAMRANNIMNILFSSTGSIYGEASEFPTPESTSIPIQTSLYGASKIACEALIQAYCEGYGFKSWIYRFVGILGPRYSHGHIIDFYHKLLNDPTTLQILGNGKQKKSYLHVSDCIEAILCSFNNVSEKVNIFNLGLDAYCNVDHSANLIINKLGLSSELTYSGGDRGWVGDNPFIYLDNSKISAIGWTPKYNLDESIEATVDYLLNN